MKMILAIVRPERLQGIQEALVDAGYSGFTVTEGRGFGNEECIRSYRGTKYKLGSQVKARIEVAVPDDQADEAVEIICDAAFTGDTGDGKIFVYSLDSCTRVRTGEIGEASV